MVRSGRRHNFLWHVAGVTVPRRLHCLDYAPTASGLYVPPTYQTKGTRGDTDGLFQQGEVGNINNDGNNNENVDDDDDDDDKGSDG